MPPFFAHFNGFTVFLLKFWNWFYKFHSHTHAHTNTQTAQQLLLLLYISGPINAALNSPKYGSVDISMLNNTVLVFV